MEGAVRQLWAMPQHRPLMCDAYLGPDPLENAARYAASGEFAAIRDVLGSWSDGVIVDLGAGNGIAAYALAHAGAARVYAVEPDPSPLVGHGAVRRIRDGLPIEIVAGVGEHLPLMDEIADVVLARQVLHHVRDLAAVLRECHRVLRPGGLLLACREHVVDDDVQREAFLAAHPIHQRARNENAHSLQAYVQAIRDSAFCIQGVLGPWDSVINAAPAVRSEEELAKYPTHLLATRLGTIGAAMGRLAWIRSLVWFWLRRPVPGRLYTFVASKP